MNQTTKELLNLIHKSTSPYHTVAASRDLLLANGFAELSLAEDWTLAPDGKYFVTCFDSSLFAFRTGKAGSRGLKIAAAHTDFPCFRLKPAAEVNTQGYGTLNVEGYGGMIVSTWMDRPRKRVTVMHLPWPARASSMELERISKTACSQPSRASEPKMTAGRLRTRSAPFKDEMLSLP